MAAAALTYADACAAARGAYDAGHAAQREVTVACERYDRQHYRKGSDSGATGLLKKGCDDAITEADRAASAYTAARSALDAFSEHARLDDRCAVLPLAPHRTSSALPPRDYDVGLDARDMRYNASALHAHGTHTERGGARAGIVFSPAGDVLRQALADELMRYVDFLGRIRHASRVPLPRPIASTVKKLFAQSFYLQGACAHAVLAWLPLLVARVELLRAIPAHINVGTEVTAAWEPSLALATMLHRAVQGVLSADDATASAEPAEVDGTQVNAALEGERAALAFIAAMQHATHDAATLTWSTEVHTTADGKRISAPRDAKWEAAAAHARFAYLMTATSAAAAPLGVRKCASARRAPSVGKDFEAAMRASAVAALVAAERERLLGPGGAVARAQAAVAAAQNARASDAARMPSQAASQASLAASLALPLRDAQRQIDAITDAADAVASEVGQQASKTAERFMAAAGWPRALMHDVMAAALAHHTEAGGHGTYTDATTASLLTRTSQPSAVRALDATVARLYHLLRPASPASPAWPVPPVPPAAPASPASPASHTSIGGGGRVRRARRTRRRIMLPHPIAPSTTWHPRLYHHRGSTGFKPVERVR